MVDYYEERWDDVYRTLPDEELPWEARRPDPDLVAFLETMSFPKGSKVLDLGCGLGTQSIYLAEQGYKVTGVDVSPAAVERASQRIEGSGLPLSFIQANAIDLPFEDGEFAFIFDRGCFHHIQTRDRLAYRTEICRVLKPQGHMLLISFRHVAGLEDLKDLFSPCFEVSDISETTYTEPSTGIVRYFYVSKMQKK